MPLASWPPNISTLCQHILGCWQPFMSWGGSLLLCVACTSPGSTAQPQSPLNAAGRGVIWARFRSSTSTPGSEDSGFSVCWLPRGQGSLWGCQIRHIGMQEVSPKLPLHCLKIKISSASTRQIFGFVEKVFLATTWGQRCFLLVFVLSLL